MSLKSLLKILSFISASMITTTVFASTCPLVVAGHGSFGNPGASTVTLPCEMPNNNYSVTITPSQYYTSVLTTSNKTTNSFRVNNAGTYDSTSFDWIAVQN